MIYEKEKRYIIPFTDVPSDRAEMPEISVDARRGNYTEVETGFPEDMAIKEAERCLGCRRCLGCAMCWAECKPEAIDAFEKFNSELGYGNFSEVITDLQFERMLSPTGPTQGMVLSPRDGEIAARLAIVQGHPNEEEAHLLDSLLLGVNESILALDRTQDLEVVLISPLCRPFQDKFLADAEKVQGLRIVAGSPESVEREPDAEPLNLVYSENGAQKKESFDLIVVLTKPKISPELVSLSKKLELDIV